MRAGATCSRRRRCRACRIGRRGGGAFLQLRIIRIRDQKVFDSILVIVPVYSILVGIDPFPNHNTAKAWLAEVSIKEMCGLGDVQVFSRICSGGCSRKTKVDFGIFACSSFQEAQKLTKLITEAARVLWHGRKFRICSDPVTRRARICVVILNEENIERNPSNHNPHLVVWNNALRSTRDEILFCTRALREVADKSSDHFDIVLLFT